MLSRRAIVAAFAAIMVAGSLPTPVVAAPPAAWGWVVARNPTLASYAPSSQNQRNSAGTVITVNRLGVGNYEVLMPGVAHGYGGDVQVSTLGASPRFCFTNGLSISPAGDVTVYVICRLFFGTLVDTPFTASYMARGTNSGQIAYAFANLPTATDYAPVATYRCCAGPTIHRSGPGNYLVRFPGVDSAHGNIQVTGYIDGPCVITDTGPDGTALSVGVRCLNGDSKFMILYTNGVGLTTIARPSAAYLRGYPLRPAGSRTPSEFRYSSVGQAPSLGRTGPGAYVVTLTGMPADGGVAHVTARGSTNHYCWIGSVGSKAVGVRCALLSGALDDSNFELTFTK